VEWIKDPRYTNTYYTTKKFNGYQYNVLVITEESPKTIKYWIHASSGKKRREFEIFENKENKSLGGVRAIFWIKEAMYDFPRCFKNMVRDRQQYICIGWSNNRRRNIYSRLIKEGFEFRSEQGRKILIKKL